jgi:hypothetical protein
MLISIKQLCTELGFHYPELVKSVIYTAVHILIVS